MKKIKVMTVFGTRPEAIKMAPLVKELQKHDDKIETVVCVTAQHRQMLDQVLEIFSITPDLDLNLMKQGQTLASLTSSALTALDKVMEDVKPDLVLVHGDTTTAFVSAMAAFYRQIPVGHVEAGLRTYNKYSPFPEEINRQFISLVADLNFAPTEKSRQNLLSWNISDDTIFVTGNTAIDVIGTTVSDSYSHEALDWAKDSRLVLLTAHRRENLGDIMHNMFSAIRDVLDKHEDVKVIYPVHMNPIVVNTAKEVLGDSDRIKLISPLDVLDFHNFMNAAHLILTDSGGIQEEAPSLGKPVVVLRDTTERPEGVEAGTLVLAGTNRDDIFNIVDTLLTDEDKYNAMSHAVNPYGDGTASRQIVDAILKKYF